MKKQLTTQALYAASLLAISLATIPAHAALTKVAAAPKAEQAIVEDEIRPEAAAEADEEEVVVVKKARPRTVVKKTTVVHEKAEITPPVVEDAPAPVVTKPSAGQQLDAGMKAKMEDVQNQFEQALLKSLDRIKITIDDGAAPQGLSTPKQTETITDGLVGASASEQKPEYIGIKEAPEVNDDEADLEDGALAGGSEAKLEKKSDRKIRVAPVFGKTNINSTAYSVDSRYTAGFELEMDVDTNFALVLGYSYSQYNIGLASANPFYQNGFNNNLQTLGYNQNLFEADGRVYLMPAASKFRLFGGAGVGYNVGYLNYQQNQYVTNVAYNPYYNQGYTDYEVKSWLGLLSAGANLNVSENVAIGALFKYAMVFSSSQNQALNNYAFVPNGQSYGNTTDQAVVGGSLQNDSFYSILGTVKVAF